MTGDICYSIHIQLYAPPGQALEIKEDTAAYLERFGGVKVVSVDEKPLEQLRFM